MYVCMTQEVVQCFVKIGTFYGEREWEPHPQYALLLYYQSLL